MCLAFFEPIKRKIKGATANIRIQPFQAIWFSFTEIKSYVIEELTDAKYDIK